MRSSGGLAACREHVGALQRGPSQMTHLLPSGRCHVSGGCCFAAEEAAALQLLEERKRRTLPERVSLRQRKVVVAGDTAQLGAGQRILHMTTQITLQTCGGAQPFLLMNMKAA